MKKMILGMCAFLSIQMASGEDAVVQRAGEMGDQR